MAKRAQIFLWQRSASPAWLAAHAAELQAATGGEHAIVERPGRARALIQAPCADDSLVRKFGGKMEKLPTDWLLQFAPQNKPIRIGTRLVITSEESDEPNALRIPAGAAFGTGEHATTAMSLRLLERYTRRLTPGWRMLDAGTGSGILALAGRRFGAGEVLAIDHDALAISTAKRNARENGIRRVTFVVGDVRDTLAGRYDLIAANLFSELLCEVLPGFAKALAKDGRLILSGVMRLQESRVLRALRAAGFGPRETRRRGKWIALVAEKRG